MVVDAGNMIGVLMEDEDEMVPPIFHAWKHHQRHMLLSFYSYFKPKTYKIIII